MSDKTVESTCPCCSARLTIHAATGEVLAHTKPERDLSKTFDDAMDRVRSGAAKRQDAFDRALNRTRQLDDVLSEKFEAAKKKAAEDGDDKPTNPLDLD